MLAIHTDSFSHCSKCLRFGKNCAEDHIHESDWLAGWQVGMQRSTLVEYFNLKSVNTCSGFLMMSLIDLDAHSIRSKCFNWISNEVARNISDKIQYQFAAKKNISTNIFIYSIKILKILAPARWVVYQPSKMRFLLIICIISIFCRKYQINHFNCSTTLYFKLEHTRVTRIQIHSAVQTRFRIQKCEQRMYTKTYHCGYVMELMSLNSILIPMTVNIVFRHCVSFDRAIVKCIQYFAVLHLKVCLFYWTAQSFHSYWDINKP